MGCVKGQPCDHLFAGSGWVAIIFCVTTNRANNQESEMVSTTTDRRARFSPLIADCRSNNETPIIYVVTHLVSSPQQPGNSNAEQVVHNKLIFVILEYDRYHSVPIHEHLLYTPVLSNKQKLLVPIGTRVLLLRRKQGSHSVFAENGATSLSDNDL